MTKLNVYKFGGTAINGSKQIRDIAEIIRTYKGEELLTVISAMGKTTNALEKVLKAFVDGEINLAESLLNNIKDEHFAISSELMPENASELLIDLANVFVEVEWLLEEPALDPYPYLYDQIVSIGEILSTKIIAAYLASIGIDVIWIDARNFIKTDNNYQEANVDWKLTTSEITQNLKPLLKHKNIITQGFIGSSSENFTTTLGRDGSDYSAAIFCSSLDAHALTIWKDVSGVLNADPKWFDETEHIPDLSYQDAIELSYYGANVIHPKTLKPLQNKNIPLYVKSFIHPTGAGTVITSQDTPLPMPSYIFKVHQVLISIFPKDFSFIIEENLSEIFSLFHNRRVKVNTMQNSALSFSVSVDDQGQKTDELIDELSATFKVKYNKGLELVTIRHYNQQTIDRIIADKLVLLEVRSRYTCQMVMRDGSALES